LKGQSVYAKIIGICVVLVLLAGCKKSGPGAAASSSGGSAVTKADPNSAEQTTCPVMGGPINKQYSTVYQGKTVYFCCPACIETFKKDPGKYIDKLPQFKKQ
jgi:YHS domain-containing protein